MFFCLYYTIATGQLSVMFGLAGMFFHWKNPSIVLLSRPKHVMMVLSSEKSTIAKGSVSSALGGAIFRLGVKEKQKIISDFLLGNAAGEQQVFVGFRLRLVNEGQYGLRLLSGQNNTDDGPHKDKGSHSDEQPFQPVKGHPDYSGLGIAVIPA